LTSGTAGKNQSIFNDCPFFCLSKNGILYPFIYSQTLAYHPIEKRLAINKFRFHLNITLSFICAPKNIIFTYICWK